MGMDVAGKHGTISFNWAGWRSLVDILEEHGYDGEVVQLNDGDILPPEDAKAVAEALLSFYKKRDKEAPSGEYPKFTGYEVAYFIYALHVLMGDAEHF